MTARKAAPAPLLSVAQAAEWLGVSERTVRNFIARGELRAKRIGPKLTRIDPADVLEFQRDI